MKYQVIGIISASCCVDVEAESPEEADEIASGMFDTTICYHCRQHLDIGDIYDTIVYTESGDVAIPSHAEEQDAAREQLIRELREENARLRGLLP